MNSKASSSILERITTIDLPAIQGFNPADHYRTDNTPDGVKLGVITMDFQDLLTTSGCQPIDVPAVRRCVSIN